MDYNITYQRDAVNSYLVMKKDKDILLEDYEIEMLERNSIDKFLEINIRRFNSEKELYYNITSKQQLDEVLERKKLDSSELIQFFNDLIRIIKDCEKYFLDSNKIVLRPDMIYIDLNGFKPSFIYAPFSNNEEIIIDSIIKLTHFLFDKIDQEDVEAVLLMHKMMTLSKQPDFNINEIQSVLNLEQLETASKTKNTKNIHENNTSSDRKDNEIISKLIEQNKLREKMEKINKSTNNDSDSVRKKEKSIPNKIISKNINKLINKPSSNSINKKEKDIKTQDENFLSKYILYIVMGSIQMIVILLVLIIFKSNILYSDVTGKIKLDSLLACICVLLSVDVYISKKAYDNISNKKAESKKVTKTVKEKVKRKNNKVFESPFNNRENLFDKPLVVNDKEIITNIETNKKLNTTELINKDDTLDKKNNCIDCENETVFLDDIISPNMETNFYLIKEDTQEKIIIDNDPFLIGKLENHVDYVIPNNAVSRIHCKIVKDNNEFYIIDLNSKNGTLLNKKKLVSNKKYKLEDRMSISISNCEYTFRNDA